MPSQKLKLLLKAGTSFLLRANILLRLLSPLFLPLFKPFDVSLHHSPPFPVKCSSFSAYSVVSVRALETIYYNHVDCCSDDDDMDEKNTAPSCLRVSVSALGLPTCQGGVVPVTPCVNVHHHCQLNIVIILAIVIIIVMP